MDTYNNFIGSYIITNDDEDYKELEEVIAYLDKLQIDKLNLEDMIKLFEFVISPSDRIVTGAIYTPRNTADCGFRKLFLCL